jgi:cystathionine beta-lyase
MTGTGPAAQAPSTSLIHHPYVAPTSFAAPQPGVFKASTVFFPNVAALRSTEWKDKSGYTYGLHGTPTTYQLEERLCSLEGGLRLGLVAGGDRLFHLAHEGAHAADAVLVHFGAAGGDAGGLLRRFRIGHELWSCFSGIRLTGLQRRMTACLDASGQPSRPIGMAGL